MAQMAENKCDEDIFDTKHFGGKWWRRKCNPCVLNFWRSYPKNNIESRACNVYVARPLCLLQTIAASFAAAGRKDAGTTAGGDECRDIQTRSCGTQTLPPQEATEKHDALVATDAAVRVRDACVGTYAATAFEVQDACTGTDAAVVVKVQDACTVMDAAAEVQDACTGTDAAVVVEVQDACTVMDAAAEVQDACTGTDAAVVVEVQDACTVMEVIQMRDTCTFTEAIQVRDTCTVTEAIQVRDTCTVTDVIGVRDACTGVTDPKTECGTDHRETREPVTNNTEAGRGEVRLCLSRDKENSMASEPIKTEKWNGKRTQDDVTSKSMRTSHSRHNNQSSFKSNDLNIEKRIAPIMFLKNGNSLMTRPISIPGIGKIILNNTCSFDSILSILASSVADSNEFKKYINNIQQFNLTAHLVYQMVSENQAIKIYQTRTKLLLQHFKNNVELLVGGLKCIDAVDTAASMAEKIMKDLPSFIRTSICENNFCPVKRSELPTSKLSLNIYDGDSDILVQEELREYIRSYKEKCVYCGMQRHITVHTTAHILIELNLIPIGLFDETSTMDIQDTQLNQISQNFVKPYYCQLQHLTKNLTAGTKTYKLRGAIAFHGGLQASIGHYSAFSLRKNGSWEHYDDTTNKMTNSRASFTSDIELLIYTI